MTYPKDFLIKLSTQKHQTKYARITALDLNDMPVESIDGAITSGGPINIDGASAVRRTCQVSIAAEPTAAITNPYWALTNKFKLEIGLLNTIDTQYPDIVWLNQGIYVINKFSVSETPTHLNISISGLDKMAKLNGELGGLFATSTTLDTIEEVSKDGSITYKKQLIYDIIRNMIHELGGEPYQNIIIEDLPAQGYELWDYMGINSKGKEMPMFLFRDTEGRIKNMTFNGNKMVQRVFNDDNLSSYHLLFDVDNSGNIFTVNDDTYSYLIEQNTLFTLNDIIASDLYNYTIQDIETGTTFYLKSYDSESNESEKPNKYYIQKINYGDLAGYHKTELIYPGELIANAGETITSVLDKIKNVLGNFEYFYDINGKFIFRKKKDYVSNLFSPLNGDTIDAFVETSPYAFEFENKDLCASISNSPTIGNIKNDFIIWGTKRSEANGDKLPVHGRFAIQKKPEAYRTFDYFKRWYVTYLKATVAVWDAEKKAYVNKPAAAREDLYIIQDDNNYIIPEKIEPAKQDAYYWIEETVDPPTNKSPLYLEEDKIFKKQEKTSTSYYKAYYKENGIFFETTINGSLEKDYYYKAEDAQDYTIDKVDWRELIWLMQRDYYQHNQNPEYIALLRQKQKDGQMVESNYKFITIGDDGMTGYEPYYADMQAFWRELYNPKGESPKYIVENEPEANKFLYWSRKALYSPESLDFWIDFIDTGGPIMDYSVDKIGHRPMVDKKETSGVTAIFYNPAPEIEFVIMPYEKPTDVTDDGAMVYTPLYIQDNMKQVFNISSKGKGVSERADELIWKYACMSEGINLTCVPLYFLEVNTRVKFLGEDYTITKITTPVQYNGTMTINMTKIIQPL